MNSWEEFASCKNADHSLFEIPDYKGRLKGGLIKSTGEKLRTGLTYCERCPVFGPCGAEASDDDKKYTIRAGQMPGAYSSIMSGMANLTLSPSHSRL